MVGEEPRKERVYELGEHKVTLHADGTYYVAIISSDGRTLSVWNTSKPTVEFGLRSAIYTFKIFDSDGLLVREFEMYIVKDTDLLIP